MPPDYEQLFRIFFGDPKWKCLDAHCCTFLEQLSYYLGDLERDRYSHLKKSCIDEMEGLICPFSY
jgi:hypothetical protein